MTKHENVSKTTAHAQNRSKSPKKCCFWLHSNMSHDSTLSHVMLTRNVLSKSDGLSLPEMDAEFSVFRLTYCYAKQIVDKRVIAFQEHSEKLTEYLLFKLGV